VRCPDHPDRVVTGRCGVCGAHFCAACLSPSPLGEPVCGTCAPSVARQHPETTAPRSDRRLLWGALLVAVVLSAAGTALLLRDGDGPPSTDDSRASYRDAWVALEQTGLALELFRSREGRYPDHLEELVPDDLAAVPSDPFGAAGAPLVYATAAAGPATRLLYSLGPDRIDQRGSPFDPVDRRGDLLYPVR
jgi:hypothetical protein